MTWLPQTNARLKAIGKFDQRGDYSHRASSFDPTWQGDEDAYVQETTRTSTAGEALNKFRDTKLFVPGDIDPPVTIEIGDIVQYEYEGDTRAREITAVRLAKLEGIIHPTLRLDLRQESIELSS